MTKSTYKQLVTKAKKNFDYDFEDAKIEFAIQLGQLLKRKNLTKADFASMLGVSAPMVTKILRGDTNLTIETMVRSVRTAGGKLHLKLIDEESEGKWFELVKTQQFHQKHEKRSIANIPNLNPWKISANDYENESLAA